MYQGAILRCPLPSLLWVDTVAKVGLHWWSKILWAADATFV